MYVFSSEKATLEPNVPRGPFAIRALPLLFLNTRAFCRSNKKYQSKSTSAVKFEENHAGILITDLRGQACLVVEDCLRSAKLLWKFAGCRLMKLAVTPFSFLLQAISRHNVHRTLKFVFGCSKHRRLTVTVSRKQPGTNLPINYSAPYAGPESIAALDLSLDCEEPLRRLTLASLLHGISRISHPNQQVGHSFCRQGRWKALTVSSLMPSLARRAAVRDCLSIFALQSGAKTRSV